MDNSIELVESQTHAVELTAPQVQKLRELGRELASSRNWWGSFEGDLADRQVIDVVPTSSGAHKVLVRNAIGVLGIGNLKIFVRPKIPAKHFSFIAAHAIFRDNRLADEALEIADGADFHELLSHWLVNEAKQILRQGLSLDYQDRCDSLRFVRGRVNSTRTWLNLSQGRISIESEFSDRSVDAPENRLIKAALESIKLDALNEPELAASAHQARRGFFNVKGATRSDLAVRSRDIPVRYRRAVELARAILSHVGRDLNPGRAAAYSFLVRTPPLIEDGIREILRDGLYPSRVTAGGRVLSPSQVRSVPDLLAGEKPLTADVKYKHFGESWNRQDLAQGVFFASSYSSPAGAVIGFNSQSTSLPTVPVGPIEITPITWNASDSSAPRESASQLVADVAGWISRHERSGKLLVG